MNRNSAPLLCVLALAGCGRPPAPPEFPPLAEIGLPHAFRLSDRVYSGGAPEGDAGFAALARLGVRTVVSVDGAAPNVAAAARHGLRYVHLPFGYDGIPARRVAELAKAADSLPGPLFIHCHHGQHRGPAAVAALMLCLDPLWNAERGERWLRAAGTDPRFVGLTSVPRTAVKPTAAELARLPAEFPASAPVPDLARSMVEIAARWDRMRAAPNPEAADAVLLAEQFREAARLEAAQALGPAAARQFAAAADTVAEWESALRGQPRNAAAIARGTARIAASCTACHAEFRDRPRN